MSFLLDNAELFEEMLKTQFNYMVMFSLDTYIYFNTNLQYSWVDISTVSKVSEWAKYQRSKISPSNIIMVPNQLASFHLQ